MKDAVKKVKDVIVEKYGSINSFLEIKTEEFRGKLPKSRPYLYKLINHKVKNPGIKTLNILADMVKMPREIIYKEYSE